MSSPARILLVEDEVRLADLLRLYLERDGHTVAVVGDGQAAIDAVDTNTIDLVVLDLMLPGLSGVAVLEAIRERGDLPVLITSAKRSDVERIAGLRMGADDYLAKPFDPNELTARVAAILRRTGVASPAEELGPVSLGGGRVRFDPLTRAYTLTVGDDVVRGRLTPGEAGLLTALARRPGSVLTREQLLDSVTSRPEEVFDRVVDVHVANLRRKLGDDPATPWLIDTIPKVGYRLVADRDTP